MRVLTLTTLAVLAACASGSGGAAPASETARPSSDVLTAEEIQKSTASDAYEAVRLLRSAWLRRRGVATPRDPRGGEIVVYVNGVRMGGVGSLSTIRVEQVIELRYLSASDATMRYGTGHPAGAIEVRTR